MKFNASRLPRLLVSVTLFSQFAYGSGGNVMCVSGVARRRRLRHLRQRRRNPE